MVRITDSPDMTIAVYPGRKTKSTTETVGYRQIYKKDDVATKKTQTYYLRFPTPYSIKQAPEM